MFGVKKTMDLAARRRTNAPVQKAITLFWHSRNKNILFNYKTEMNELLSNS